MSRGGITGEELNNTRLLLHTEGTDDATSTTTASYAWTIATAGDYETPHVQAQITQRRSNKFEASSPEIYFKWIKSSFTMIENKLFKDRVKQLEKMFDEYAELGQVAMSEECIKQCILISRESAMWACGFSYFLTDRQMDVIKRTKIKNHDVLVTKMKDFTRPIPKKAAELIKKAIKKQLFDDFTILHINNKEINEERKEVEKKKDPVIFGRIVDSDRWYFVADWIDEHDDLQFQDLIKALSITRAQAKLQRKIDVNRILSIADERIEKSAVESMIDKVDAVRDDRD